MFQLGTLRPGESRAPGCRLLASGLGLLVQDVIAPCVPCPVAESQHLTCPAQADSDRLETFRPMGYFALFFFLRSISPTLPVLLSCCHGKMPESSSLQKQGFVLAHSLKGQSITRKTWWRKQGLVTFICHQGSEREMVVLSPLSSYSVWDPHPCNGVAHNPSIQLTQFRNSLIDMTEIHLLDESRSCQIDNINYQHPTSQSRELGGFDLGFRRPRSPLSSSSVQSESFSAFPS